MLSAAESLKTVSILNPDGTSTTILVYTDADLEMYYLQSRYYDAKICRFISPDSVEYLGANGDLMSYNLYAYCSNNPVMFRDDSGHLKDAVVQFFEGIYEDFLNYNPNKSIVEIMFVKDNIKAVGGNQDNQNDN